MSPHAHPAGEMPDLAALARHVSGLTFDALPAEVVVRAQEVVRDTIGVIIGGMGAPEVGALADHAAGEGPGTTTLLGHGAAVRPGWAVLVHGTAGTTLEMDEGHAFARGHAAIHALPPALALAQRGRRGGRDLLTAFLVGYEVAARVGVATRLRAAVHPFGAWGVLGAAAVAAWFRGADAAAMLGTIEVAASFGITPSFNAAFQGANVRNTYAGTVNRLGLLAAEYYALGFRGERGGVRTTFGQILGDAFDSSALSEGLGDRYEILRGYFKPYSACRYTHAAVDGVLQLRTAEGVDAAAIRWMEVATYDIAARLRDPAPQSALAGRFSTPYVVAATWLHGSAGPEIFTPEVMFDKRVRDLAGRVKVQEDPVLTAMTPARRPARVTAHFQDGTSRQVTITSTRGDPDRPMSPAEMRAKFEMLTTPQLGAGRAAAAWERLGRLTDEETLDPLLSVLT